MIRIAVVEDNPIDLQKICNNIKNYFIRTGGVYKLHVFEDSESALKKTELLTNIDLFLMDIELPGISGMNLAIKLRQAGYDSLIVFATNMVQYAVQGYDVSAIDFIVKPIEDETFQVKFDGYIKRIKGRKRTILIKNRETVKKCPVSDIIYVEVRDHQIHIITRSGEENFSGTLKQMEDELQDIGFARCNKCYLVNLKYVNSICNDKVDVGGYILQISRRERKKFMEAFAGYEGD